MKKLFATLGLLSLALIPLAAQDLPVIKIDFNEASRKDNEVLEPGYTPWAVGKANTYSEKTVDNVTLVLRSDGVRASWSKTLVQAAVENSRFTMDGLTMEGDKTPGEYTLIIKGLPAGTHTLQTFHNDWADPAQYCGLPIHVFVNGAEKAVVSRSWQKTSTAEAACAKLSFSVASEADSVVLRFYTDAEDDFDNETGTQTKLSGSPLMNGFELNTITASDQAKKPYPADGDLHADADGGSVVLSWSPANVGVTAHYLYFGKDEAALGQADTSSSLFMAKKVYADTVFAMDKLRNLDTYYWRVDEEDSTGQVTLGKVWSFRPRQLAFPGAEGYGRYANGGRGGRVVYVTNLNSTGPGSFREAVKDGSGPRTILFMVSGLIDLQLEKLFIDDNLTIAGQSAPGKGICLAHSDMGIGDDNICRFMRFRRGISTNGNAMGVAGCDHTIVDHTSTSWGTDETISGRNALNVTFQYSMISEALGISHGFAATIGGKIGSYHHNFLVNCSGRNWSMAGNLDGSGNYITRMDLFNNVCYNWWKRTTDGSAHEVNFVNNVYKMGPDSNKKYLFEMQHEGYGKGTNRAYVSGNIRINKDGSVTEDQLNETYRIDISDGVTIDYETFVDEPFFPSYATIHSARDAYKIVLSDMGANQPVLDDHDRRNVYEALNQTWTYTGQPGYRGQIDSEEDAGGFEVYPEASWAEGFDDDLDGLPNWFEAICGTDPASPAEDFSDSNADPDGDGYTLLEDYLNFMAEPHVFVAPGAQTSLKMTDYFAGFTASPQYRIEGNTNENVKMNLADGTMTIEVLPAATGMARATMTVTDAEGSTYSRQIGVVVSRGLQDGLPEPVLVGRETEIKRYQLYSTDGKLLEKKSFAQPVVLGELPLDQRPGGVYILKTTDSEGRQATSKLLVR